MKGRILIVDDDRAMCETIAEHLRLEGLEPEWSTSSEEGFARVAEGGVDVVLTDLNMPGMDGVELCDRVANNRPDIPVVVFTAFGSMETAVAALRAGAFDFVSKPIEMEMLTLTVERALRHKALQDQVKTLSESVARGERFDLLLGSSPVMKRLFRKLERVASSDESVLIAGESGTGKELVARALHRKSKRREGPFIAVNCAALPEALVESELFGHERGAFTGAAAGRKGMFLEADGGTLLLDEIGELPLALQPKLLRALEQRVVRPVGGRREHPFDARVIAATNKDLDLAVEEGRFREDLFFRINVIQIELPPLRSRGTDILLYAQHFLEECTASSGKSVTGFSQAAAEKLLDYRWPGNVRELRNAVARAVALTRFEEIAVEDLPERIRAYRSASVIAEGHDPDALPPLEEVERRYILHVLDAVGDNRTRAARILGVHRKTLYRKLRRYDRQD